MIEKYSVKSDGEFKGPNARHARLLTSGPVTEQSQKQQRQTQNGMKTIRRLEYFQNAVELLSPEDRLLAAEKKAKIDDMLGTLTPPQKFVMEHRFYRDETLEEIGCMLRKNKEQIR